MKLTVRRVWESKAAIIGDLLVDDQWECFTLEPSRENPFHAGHPCVAAGGPYRVILTPSPHLGYVTPEVLNVPGRSDIRLHVGNDPKDTLGCTLVGMEHDTDTVLRSKVAFERLMTLLREATDIEITYTDPED